VAARVGNCHEFEAIRCHGYPSISSSLVLTVQLPPFIPSIAPVLFANYTYVELVLPSDNALQQCSGFIHASIKGFWRFWLV